MIYASKGGRNCCFWKSASNWCDREKQEQTGSFSYTLGRTTLTSGMLYHSTREYFRCKLANFLSLKKFGLSNSNLSVSIAVLFGYWNFFSFLFHHRGNPIFGYCTYIVPDGDIGLNMILIGQLRTIRTMYHVYNGGTLPSNNKGLRKGIKSYCERLTSRKRDQFLAHPKNRD